MNRRPRPGPSGLFAVPHLPRISSILAHRERDALLTQVVPDGLLQAERPGDAVGLSDRRDLAEEHGERRLEIRYVITAGFGGGSAGGGISWSSPSRSKTTRRLVREVAVSLPTGSAMTSKRSHEGVSA
jgi:hypothetical protein